MTWIKPVSITLVACVVGYVFFKQATDANDSTTSNDPPSEDQIQEPSILDKATATISDTIAAITGGNDAPEDVVQQRRMAFLDMLAYSEGTSGANGYYTMFGGRLCENLDDHPRQLFPFTNTQGVKQYTSAAGRYQFLSKTWDGLAKKLGLTDFGQDSQDAGALELLRQCGALSDIDSGNVQSAIFKARKTWASLPGAGYNQPERKLDKLIAAYENAGGDITTA